MRLIRYTDLGGNPAWVVDSWVQAIRKPHNHEFQENAHSVIVLSGYALALQEDLATAVRLFNGD